MAQREWIGRSTQPLPGAGYCPCGADIALDASHCPTCLLEHRTKELADAEARIERLNAEVTGLKEWIASRREHRSIALKALAEVARLEDVVRARDNEIDDLRFARIDAS